VEAHSGYVLFKQVQFETKYLSRPADLLYLVTRKQGPDEATMAHVDDTMIHSGTRVLNHIISSIFASIILPFDLTWLGFADVLRFTLDVRQSRTLFKQNQTRSMSIISVQPLKGNAKTSNLHSGTIYLGDCVWIVG
jgi:hypothetical protein